jgi:hypothetical protein
MTTISRGVATTLLASWLEYAGGPASDVTAVSIGITNVATGATVLAATSTGVTNPATGINAYVWTSSASLATGQYLATWTGTDPDAETVQATEILTVLAGGALGGPYSTRAKLKRRMGIPDSNTAQDTDCDDELASASSAINKFCGRQFGQATELSARSFPMDSTGVDIDDVYDLAGLLIDGVAYSTDTHTALPLDGVHDGVPGWPYERLESAWATHPIYAALRNWPSMRVVVTALWGWAEVPADIERACLMLASDGLKSKDAPFGVAGFGDYVVRVRANPKVAELLAPYVREPVKVAS